MPPVGQETGLSGIEGLPPQARQSLGLEPGLQQQLPISPGVNSFWK
jgi:hypothetical protein